MQGKLDEAVGEYRTAVRIQPENAEFHDTLSELLGKQRKLDEAIAEHRAAIRIQPDFAHAYNTMGDILFTVSQDYGAAAAEFRKATQYQPDNAFYHYNLGMALQSQEKLDDAIVEYRAAIELKPDFAYAHMGMGEILEFQRKWADAIVEYQTASQLDSKNADAHHSFARAVIKKPDRTERELSEALEHARLAVALRPDDGGFRNTLALAEYRAGRWAESIAAAERSVELNKSVEGFNGFVLSMALWQQGHKDQSRSFLDHAVAWTRKNDPNNAELARLWREAADLMGQPGPDASAGDLPANPFAP